VISLGKLYPLSLPKLLSFSLRTALKSGHFCDDVGLVDLSLDILSAITFLVVLIHLAFTPTFEPISNPQKNLAKARPMIDFLLVCKVRFSALVLSVTHNTTGCGSSVIFLFSNTTLEAQ
jgi:hypothetical protein